MKRKKWTENETELARQLLKKHSYATVGKCCIDQKIL
jgi:hypothetical protein